MSSGKIFLIDEKAETVKEAVESPYESEEILQRLLSRTPDILPGDQINPTTPRSWLLVKRELGVPDGESKSGRWSLDHLFLDQDGIPTFVECKRATDSRARREVVAQMLDYAANGLAYWSIDTLRQAATETALEQKTSLDVAVQRLIGSDEEEEVQDYWRKVEQNLGAGKVRLIFVCDAVPAELKRLVEFLNERLLDLEVLAVEVAQYLGQGLRALVPRVIGLTEKSRGVKTGMRAKISLSREQFFAGCSEPAAALFDRILKSAEQRRLVLYYGTQSVSVRVRVANEEREYASVIYCWPPDGIEIYLKQLPITEEESKSLRREILNLGPFQEAGSWTLGPSLMRIPLFKLNELSS